MRSVRGRVFGLVLSTTQDSRSLLAFAPNAGSEKVRVSPNWKGERNQDPSELEVERYQGFS